MDLDHNFKSSSLISSRLNLTNMDLDIFPASLINPLTNVKSNQYGFRPTFT